MVDLKSCPFCGGADIFTEPDERGSGGQWCSPIHVGCRSCKAEQRGDDVVFARANWNRRAAVEADRQRKNEPVGYFQDTGHYRYEQVGDDFKDDPDVFPLYRAPHPADTNLDYKELYEQMCERCDYLDAELAKHTEKSGEPAASAEPCRAALAGSTAPVAQKPVAWLHQCRKKPELRTLSFSASEPRLKPLGYASIPLYAAPVASAAQEPVAEVLSSRKGNDTSIIDKAFPDGAKLYTDPAAAQPIDDTQFWTVSPKASRRDLVLQIVQMNHRITALREENRGLIRHLQDQREALRNYRKGGKSIEPVFTLDHVGSWYGDDSPAGCVLVGAWTGKSFPPQGAKFYLKEKSK